MTVYVLQIRSYFQVAQTSPAPRGTALCDVQRRFVLAPANCNHRFSWRMPRTKAPSVGNNSRHMPIQRSWCSSAMTDTNASIAFLWHGTTPPAADRTVRITVRNSRSLYTIERWVSPLKPSLPLAPPADARQRFNCSADNSTSIFAEASGHSCYRRQQYRCQSLSGPVNQHFTASAVTIASIIVITGSFSLRIVSRAPT